MAGQAFALFDFDGTLCAGDSILPYLRFCVRTGIAPKKQLLTAAGGYLGQLTGRCDMSAAKAAALSFIAGQNRQKMDALAERFFQEELLPRMLPETTALLRQCAEAGSRVLVLSASPSVYMDALPAFLPVEAVLSTPCELDAQGRYTGQLGRNCRGEKKVIRLRQWLADNHVELDAAATIACGDSAHDIPLLHLAGRPLLVRPEKALRRAFPDAELVQEGFSI